MDAALRDAMRWLLSIKGYLLAALSAAGIASAAGFEAVPVLLSPDDRVLVLAPHPDDEVIACGGILQAAHAMHLPVRVVFLTYGDNNEWAFLLYRRHPVLLPQAVRGMGLVRHDEAVKADAVLGVESNGLLFLGYPDFEMMRLWIRHWGGEPPCVGMLSEAKKVPYASAFRPGAPYKGEEVLQDLENILVDFRPTKIFVSHPGDQNADHRSLYLFTRVALWDTRQKVSAELDPYLVHFRGWPQPRGYHPDSSLVPPAFFREQAKWREYMLSKAQVLTKEAALREHVSQLRSAPHYLQSFVRHNELFGDFPDVRLEPGAITNGLSAGAVEEEGAQDETLTDEERAAFTGVEIRSVRLEDRNLVLAIEFSRPLAPLVDASVYLFGYRFDRPFFRMPKLHVVVGQLGHRILDQTAMLPADTMEVRRHMKGLEFRVPLSSLGWPDRILTSARTTFGDVPLDSASWRVLELPAAGAGERPHHMSP